MGTDRDHFCHLLKALELEPNFAAPRPNDRVQAELQDRVDREVLSRMIFHKEQAVHDLESNPAAWANVHPPLFVRLYCAGNFEGIVRTGGPGPKGHARQANGSDLQR